MSRRSSTAAALVALIATLAAACTGGGASPSPVPDPVPVKIAFLHDMSVPGSAQTVAPALLGLQLAFQEAVDAGDLPVVPEVVGLDVDGDDGNAIELAHEIADDPAYVAAVIGPFWSEPVDVGDVLHDGRGPDDQRVRARSVAGHARLVVLVAHRRRGLAGSRRARRGDPRISSGGRRGVRRRRRLRSVLHDGGAARCEPRGTRDRVARSSGRGCAGGCRPTHRSVGMRAGRVDGVRPGRDVAAHRADGGGLGPARAGRLVRDEDRVVPVHDGRRGRRDDRHVRLRRPGLVHATGGAPLHPRLPVAVRLAPRRVRRRGMGRGRDAARDVPRGSPGSPDGRRRPVDGRRIRGPGEHVPVRRRRGARVRVGAASTCSGPKACDGTRWVGRTRRSRCRWGRPASCRSRHAGRAGRTRTHREAA